LTCIILMILNFIYRRNMLLIAEAFWIEIIILAGMAISHTITTLPDPYGLQAACHDPRFAHWGTWIFSHVSAVFCGDCIWSGHTYHLLLCLYIIYRGFQRKSPCPSFLTASHFRILYWIVGIICLLTLISSIIIIRFHYGIDIFLALLVPILVFTNRSLLIFGIRFLYPPASKLSDEDIAMLNDREVLRIPRPISLLSVLPPPILLHLKSPPDTPTCSNYDICFAVSNSTRFCLALSRIRALNLKTYTFYSQVLTTNFRHKPPRFC